MPAVRFAGHRPLAESALIRYGNVTRAVIFAAGLLAFTSLMHLLLRHVTDPHLELSDTAGTRMVHQ